MFCNRYGTSVMFLKAYDRYDQSWLGKISMSFNGKLHPKRASTSPLCGLFGPIRSAFEAVSWPVWLHLGEEGRFPIYMTGFRA